jgi:hypothetical protein
LNDVDELEKSDERMIYYYVVNSQIYIYQIDVLREMHDVI